MESTKVNPDENIKFHPHSFGDHEIRLFQQDGELYRGIGATRADSFRELFDQGVIDRLVDQGLLIESVLTSFSKGSYKMVIHHRTVPFISYPNEWCAAMLKDAVLILIDLAIELTQYDYTLGDAHPWNLVFDIQNCRPIFVDLGSLVPIYSPNWPVFDEFCRFCLYPLMLMSQGQDQIARLLMWEDSGVTRFYLLALLGKTALAGSSIQSSWIDKTVSNFQRQIQKVPDDYRIWLKEKLCLLSSSFRLGSIPQQLTFGKVQVQVQNLRTTAHLNFLQQVQKDLINISIDVSKANSVDRSYSEYKSSASCRLLQQVISDLKPESVLSLGHELTSTAILAAVLGCHVVALDTNINTITQLYHYSKEHKLPILPLLIDFTKPTPARGLGDHWSISAHKRFACDLVVATGLVNSVVQQQRLSFDHLTEGFSLFSKKFLLVDFMEFDDPNLLKKMSWFRQENLLASLKSKFSQVNILHQPSSKKTLWLCEK